MKKLFFLLIVVFVSLNSGQIWYDLGKTKAKIINNHGTPIESKPTPTHFIYHGVSDDGPLDIVIIFKNDLAVNVGCVAHSYD